MAEMKAGKGILELKSNLYHKVQTSEDLSALKQCLEKCHKRDLESWRDDDGYDILHHAIMASNIEAIGIMFALGIFKPPHEPKFHPYLHLAANFGNKAIMAQLLQERPRDYSEKKTAFKWVKIPSEVSSVTPGKITHTTPVDVAGDSGNVGCVKIILDFYALRNRVETGSNYLCIACAGNSPSALRLLLQDRHTEEEMKQAVGSALKLANAECLDVLFRCNPKLTSLFSGMNLYHVLYSYNKSFKKEWYESLLTVTTVLLKHRQNPLSHVPFRTYPLYSLINHTPYDFRNASPYLISCMIVLLNAGADPNFDEHQFESEHDSLNIQTAFGRSAYSSAFHCLFDTVTSLLKEFRDEAVSIRRFVTRYTEILLKHGANTNIAGPIDDEGHTGNALHAFLRVSVVLGLDERSITTFRLLIQNGADPNLCSDDYYPINVLIDQILLGLTTVNRSKERFDPDVFMEYIKEVVGSILDRMSPENVRKAVEVKFDGKPVNDVQKKLLKFIKDQLNSRATSIWSLKEMCKIVILDRCERKPTTVVQLPIPTQLKKFINGVGEYMVDLANK